VNAAPSSEHSKVAVNWSDEKVNWALASVVGSSGLELIVVSGSSVSGGTSTVHEKLAGGSSISANPFVDCTSKVWLSTVTSLTVTGEVHDANSAPSSEHMYVTPGWSAEKVRVAVVELVMPGSAGTSAGIVVSAEPTTVQVYDAGVASTLRLGSMAR